ncbi:MAG TPA: peptide MFS transporter, partial [Longimicrobium sp.]|nr:peptide MFS transporter [Longimicrobium sp.]
PSQAYAGGGPAPHASTDTAFFGHPRGLSTLFFTELWERFSYYGIRPLLVLFMAAALTDGGMGMSRDQAAPIVGIYGASVYLASLPGGWIADRLLGLRRAIWYGGILIAMGHGSIALSAIAGKPAFFLGLFLIVLGTGLLKPNISAIVGDLYPEGGARRDAGFSIFYMGINIGALFAPLITGYLGEDQQRFGWHYGFGAAGVGMVIGLIWYRMTADRTLGDIGREPSGSPQERAEAVRYLVGGFGVLALIVLGVYLMGLTPLTIAENMSYVMATLAALYFAYLFFGAGLDTGEKKRVAVIIVLFVFATIFWSAFEQAPTSLNLFAADYTDREFGSWTMPVLWLQSANSFFVITLAPLFAALWVWLARNRGGDLSSPAKFAAGLFFAAIGFAIMIFAARAVLTGGVGTRVSPWWLVASYFFQTVGELCLSPVGLSSMTKLSPRRFTGQMMGVWFMAAAMGNLIAGIVGGHVDPENPQQMPALFERTTLSLLIATAVLAALIIPIRRMMAEKPAPSS